MRTLPKGNIRTRASQGLEGLLSFRATPKLVKSLSKAVSQPRSQLDTDPQALFPKPRTLGGGGGAALSSGKCGTGSALRRRK